MVKCPFCGFGNEDGALFCEQCKSDISNVAPASEPPPMPLATPTPLPESMPPMEMFPMASIEPVPEAPILAAIVEDEVVAEVIPISPEDEPAQVEVIEAVALVAEPIVEAPPPVAEMPAPPPPVEAPPAPVAEAPVPPPPPMMPAAQPAPAVAEAPKPPAPSAGTPIPPRSVPKLVVQRGLKIGEEYPVYPGENYIGRADEKPVDIDLQMQEPEDRVWCSRQHALLVYDEDAGSLTIEDLNSSNGTFVNRERVYPGQPRQLYIGNTVQIGTVHLKIKV